jgi:hypothetical protein
MKKTHSNFQSVFSSSTSLLKLMQKELDESRGYGKPHRRVGHDGSEPIWTWLVTLVQLRSDWSPLVGDILRRFANEEDPFTNIAIADVIGKKRHCAALFPALQMFIEPLADVRLSYTPTWWEKDGGVTFGKVMQEHSKLLSELSDPYRLARLEGQYGPKAAMVNLVDAKDLQVAVQQSARRGRFKWTIWGSRPLSWLYPESLGRPWINPLLHDLLAAMLQGSHAEVVTALDWMYERRDLWQHVDALQGAKDSSPNWWTLKTKTKPIGWRKRWPVASFLQDKTLGDVVEFLLPQAHQQAALPPIHDLPLLDTP